MISSAQLKAARAISGIDQKELAERAGLSLPTIQRMEASNNIVRANVESAMKVMAAFESLGVELIGPNQVSQFGGRGVRLRNE
jgi:transcriptional regulator with XRE-family HTH domain